MNRHRDIGSYKWRWEIVLCSYKKWMHSIPRYKFIEAVYRKETNKVAYISVYTFSQFAAYLVISCVVQYDFSGLSAE